MSPRSRRAGGLSVGSPRTRAEGFRQACVELGGYCQAFAVFLSGRADLLPFAYLEELRDLPSPFLGDPSLGLPAEAGWELEELSACLYTRVYRGRIEGRPAVVEYSCAPEASVRDADWHRFRRCVAPLEGFPEGAIVDEDVLVQFRAWLELHADLAKKRLMLENLQQAPAGSLNLIPTLVPDVQSGRLLAYEDLERVCGPSSEPAKQSQLFLEAVLEQILILAFVAVDVPWPELRLLDGNRVGFRVWPFMEALPVQHYHPVLQYVASSVAEDGGRAMRMLLRIVRHEDGAVLESDLWRQLSALRFEVAADHRISASGEKLLEFWKALAAEGVRRPLFLDLLHRELILTFQSAYDPKMDWIATSASAVLGRLVTTRFADVMNPERAREWVVGSSLAALGTARQFGVLLEQLRDNEFSVTVKTDAVPSGRRPVRSAVGAAVAGLLFFLALQGALLLPQSLLGHVSIAACLVFGAVFFVVASHRD
ncbi:MAG: hypothetical protein WAO20_07455 [Acidobacteriota bacterium]